MTAPGKNALSLTEVRTIQMDILSAVDEFCGENGIPYSLACGTLLGAIRHGGYIPWDDDIDIYMLRPDYDRFVGCFPETYKGRYKLKCLSRDRSWKLTVAKLYDSGTVLVENSILRDTIGVNIDLFPIDRVPEDENEWKEFDSKRRHLIDRHQSIVSDLGSIPFSFRKAALLLTRLFARPLARYIDRFARQFNDSGSDYVFESVMGQLLRNRFNIRVFNNLEKVCFEDRQYYAFAAYEEYLSNAYGDYMKLPPEEKRVSHHSFNAFLK